MGGGYEVRVVMGDEGKKMRRWQRIEKGRCRELQDEGE
jgi:hypothetical protein